MLGAVSITPLFNRQFQPAVIKLVNAAIHSVDICIFDWRTYPTSYGPKVTAFNRAIVDAILRGVRVRVVLNSRGNAARLQMLGCKVHVFNSSRMMHTKLMIVDGCSIVCGSHNYTESAFSSNEELSMLCVYDDVNNPYTTYFKNVFPL